MSDAHKALRRLGKAPRQARTVEDAREPDVYIVRPDCPLWDKLVAEFIVHFPETKSVTPLPGRDAFMIYDSATGWPTAHALEFKQ